MKVFFDTSVLVPLFQTGHPHHPSSFSTFQKHMRGQASCAAHSLAEVYSALTRMPPPNRATAEQAMLFVTDLQASLKLVALDAGELFQAVCDFASIGITGGAVYDGLLARCALKAKAEVIYTWNLRDFQRLGPEIARRLRVPGGETSTP